MKKYKILIITIIVLLSISVFAVSAFAEEIDTNKYVGVNVDGEYEYYPILGMATATWIDYIEAHRNIYSDSPFYYLEDYVIFRESLLLGRDGSYIKTSDNVTVAAGWVYKLKPIYEVNENVLTVNFPVETLWGKLVFALSKSYPDSLLKLGGYSKYDVYYDAKPVKVVLSYESYFVTSDMPTSYDQFVLGNECYHAWSWSRALVEPTCVSDGLYEYKCRLCFSIKTESVTKSNEYCTLEGNYTEYIEPTCLKEGYYKGNCVNCNRELSGTVDKIGHVYPVPTCTESSFCTICGAECAAALGHDYDWTQTCKRCGDNPIKSGIDNAVANVKNGWSNLEKGWNDFWNPDDNFLKDLLNLFIPSLNNGADSTFSKVPGLIALILLIIGLYYILKLIMPLIVKRMELNHIENMERKENYEKKRKKKQR